MNVVQTLKERALAGVELSVDDATRLETVPLEELRAAADEIRRDVCGSRFDLCSIVNAKCGRCSEDCKYCAQSVRYRAACPEAYPLLSTEELVRRARNDADRGVLRFSLVASGKRLSEREVDDVCRSIRAIRDRVGIRVCVSLGLLDEEAFCKINDAGATRVHCNLESSERYFPQVCSTHSFREKLETLRAARRAGLELCSGGIVGLGETERDRWEMAVAIRSLGVKSVPINLLNPIPGTPCESNRRLTDDEFERVVAIFRFLIPDAAIRLAGGRGLLDDRGERCFRGGANAAITGDMLTTAGISVETDRALAKKLDYRIESSSRKNSDAR